ncbi:MAG: DnaJ domain-containing protein [Archangiaceae bacterium]|nr:DnaJ domain-containing protein [Archangiaceae bacterium]
MPELSVVMDTKGLSGEESVMRERLAAKAAAMRKLDYFEILGLPTTANREDVKRSYFQLAKEYHPDKHFGSASAEVRQLAQQIYDLISTAHDTLADPIERERYVKELAQGVKRDIGDEVGKILAAEGKFQRGEELMRQREYAGAWRHFQDAIALYADEGEFHAWLGWARFQMDPKDTGNVEQATQNIEKAITLNPRLDKAYLFLGYIHKAAGRPDKAEKQFEKAIQSNPDCTEALRELRLLGRSKR